MRGSATLLSMSMSLLLLGLGVAPSPGNTLDQASNTEDTCCKLVTEAMEAAGKLQPGMTRADVEKDFREDGGLSFVGKEQGGSSSRHGDRYVYRRCPEIKIDVDFRIEGSADVPSPTPSDHVLKVSRPYLEYPVAD